MSTSVPAGAQAAAGTGDRVTSRIGQAAAHQVLENVAAELKSRPSAGLSHYRDLTVLLLELRHAMGSMSATDRARAAALTADGPADPVSYPTCTGTITNPVILSKNGQGGPGHFCVHYTIVGSDAASEQQAQLTADTFEHVYAYEVGTLGYRRPISDGDGLTDVTLEDMGAFRYYGECTPIGLHGVKASAACAVDNDFSPNQFPGPTSSLGDLEVTAAHEFFHAIQFGYNSYQERWLLEGSAVWMEDQVYPSVNDYLQYVRAGGAIVNPRTPIDTDAQSQWYAATLFWKFLSESRHDPSIVKQVWNLASTYVNRTAMQDVVSALAARGLSFRSEFGLFGVWNTLPPRTYVDRSLYPAPAYWARAHLTRSRRDTGWRKVVLNHLTNASMIVRPGPAMPRRTRPRVSINAPYSPIGWATVQVRMHSGQVLIYTVPLNNRGDGTKVVTFNPRQVSSVVLVATNASIYGADNRAFLVRARALL
ncbi:MAG: hypothetical protein JWR52_3135 [Marmoricola sp.]|nr:hypothetical protein [Marmoricola sp.]